MPYHGAQTGRLAHVATNQFTRKAIHLMTTDSAVVKPEKNLTSDLDLMQSIKSFEDAIALLASEGIEIVSSEDFGDGFSVASKDSLVGVPFLVLNMRWADGDHGEFVIIHVVTKTGVKGIVVDGSTGIYKQSLEYRRVGKTQGVIIREGLIRSTYDYTDEKTGELKPATTFYLSY